ncbi:MAG: hypothetical protein HY052_02735 [Proteobacteria bacterium]|nr:hypothetical protein [Pseudomonadota bacterium]
MPRSVRMLQTGSLGGNPFEVLGADSLGAQAFMQSFFVSHFPLGYINAFDAISCFVLGLFLLREMGYRFGIHRAFLLASLLTFIVINPQYVNISSLYSGSLMILATVFASIVFADAMGGTDNRRAFAGAFAVALFLTSLVALKTTFAVFAATYFVVYFGCALYLSENRPRIVRSMLFTMLAAMTLIAPWILISWPNYLTALHLALEGNAAAVAGGGDGGMDFISKILTVFSTGKSGWGGNTLTYSLLVTLLAAVGVTSLFLLKKSRDILYRRRSAAISAACVATAIGYVTNVYLLDPGNAVRYTIPILIAVASVTSLLLVRNGLSSLSLQNLKRSAIASSGGMAILGVAVVIGGVFAGELVNRGERAYQMRTLLSFPVNEMNLNFNANMMGKSTAAWLLDKQNMTEEGSKILAIMPTPFHFDFARNPIFSTNASSFLTPWSDFPLNADPEVARKYLSDLGIRYVMFQYRGPSVQLERELQGYTYPPYWIYRKAGETNIRFRKALRYLAENSLWVDITAGLVIVDISQKALSPYPIPWPKN